jgi:hypothetical protein
MIKRLPNNYMFRASKGFALLITFLMLVLVFMLGFTFFLMMHIERLIARNYMNKAKAVLTAEAGITTAVARIINDCSWTWRLTNTPYWRHWQYWGNQTETTKAIDTIKIYSVPPEWAQIPSYAVREENSEPKLITVQGKRIGYSGSCEGGTYGLNTDIWNLKIIDTSAQIHINDGLGHPYDTAVLRRILNTLGQQIDVKDLGNLILDNRPPTGYKSKWGLLHSLSRRDFNRARNFLCTHTWQDHKVCNPVPLSLESKEAYRVDEDDIDPDLPILYQTRPLDKRTGTLILRYGRGYTADGIRNNSPIQFYGSKPGSTTDPEAICIFGKDELNPRYIEITHRAPININTAPREILIALFDKLEGFFVMEQLRYLPNHYYWYNRRHLFTYIPPKTNRKSGEIGIIFRTTPIQNPEEIADKIIERRGTKPFTSWQDFNRFIDSLVGTIIVDPRPASYFKVFDKLGEQETQLYTIYASQAMADVIKANFNPNLHLNEINPDARLWGWVDKTDLIQRSVEFCFFPTGIFEIESCGTILRPASYKISGPVIDASQASDNKIMAQRRIIVEARLFNIYRETTQMDFYRGTFSIPRSPYQTQGGLACISGPEPENGPAPLENDYEGYVTLATIGGSLKGPKPKGSLQTTPPSTSKAHNQSSTLHTHLDLDFKLHHSASGVLDPLTQLSIDQRSVGFWNAPDWTETDVTGYTSPYCAAQDPLRYRIAWAYRYTDEILRFPLYAPLDHRIDGFYSERHANLVYPSQGNFRSFQGTISYWIKPGFIPELNGKARIFFSIAKSTLNPGRLKPFGHFLVGEAVLPRGSDPEEVALSYQYLFRPIAMAFGYLRKMDDNNPYVVASITGSLNHIGHDHSPILYFPLRRHSWIHVALSWYREGKGSNKEVIISETSAPAECRLYINGDLLPDTSFWSHCADKGAWVVDYTTETEGDHNPLRIGGERSFIQKANFPGDSTIDEVFLWDKYIGFDTSDPEIIRAVKNQWSQGRYYRENDAEFSSQKIPLHQLAYVGRRLPGPNMLPDPYGRPRWRDMQMRLKSTAEYNEYTHSYLTILGITWTALVEGIFDYKDTKEDGPKGLNSQMELSLYLTQGDKERLIAGPFLNQDSSWATIFYKIDLDQIVDQDTFVRYKVRINTMCDKADSILLESPILDDVSIYYAIRPQFLTRVESY